MQTISEASDLTGQDAALPWLQYENSDADDVCLPGFGLRILIANHIRRTQPSGKSIVYQPRACLRPFRSQWSITAVHIIAQGVSRNIYA